MGCPQFTPEQQNEAEAVIAGLNASKQWSEPVATEVTEVTTFHPAESYYQHYYEHNPHQPYCQFVVAPKVAKARTRFRDKLRMERD